MALTARNHEVAVVSEENRVRARLEDLGLTLELLQDAVEAWFLAAASTSKFEPKTAPGSKGWFAAVGLIRESKVTDGWKAKDIRNWPVVVNGKTQIAITATTGDMMTGIVMHDRQPRTKNMKGIVVHTAVKSANEQLVLRGFEADRQLAPVRAGKKAKLDFITWVLLVCITPNGARAELSLPAELYKRRIVSWHERIILPEFVRGTAAGFDDHEESEALNVPVERKT